MAKTKASASNQTGIILLIAAAMAIIGSMCILGGYQSISCSNLCLSKVSANSNYAITATINYGHPLPFTRVLVIINGLYKSEIETGAGSVLQFQAPLKLGADSITVEYDSSQSTATFFYSGGMLYMLLIPLSAVLFLLIKRLSSDSTGKNGVVFYFDDKMAQSPTTNDLKDAISSVNQKGKRAVFNLPELITDVSAQLARMQANEGESKIEKDPVYLSQKISMLNLAYVSSGCVSNSPISKEEMAARIFYEKSILCGSPLSIKGNSPKAFLKANKIIFKADLLIQFNSVRAAKRAPKLFLLNDAEACSIGRAVRSYSRFGASLLLIQLENGLEIIRG